jgi:TonB family protein
MKRGPAYALLRFFLPGLIMAAGLCAQDVTVSPTAWVHPDDPPDQMPVLRHPLEPDIPAKLHNAAEIGYSTHDIFVDDKGVVLSAAFHATTPAFEHDGYMKQLASMDSMSAEFRPAKRAGKPVNSQIHFSVVYNPASAGTAGPDASPRLLDAYAVVDPNWRTVANDPSIRQRVVWATVIVDDRGTATSVKDVAALLSDGVKAWRFAPARRGGRPVVEDVRMPFIVTEPELDRDSTPPKVIKQPRPEYPISMRKSGLRGEVVVDFVVDIEGHVRRPFVARTLNPEFNAPAIEAVSAWVFDPGRRNGVPVYTHLEVPVYFALTSTPDGGADPLVTTRSGRDSSLPEDLRVDVEPKIRGLITPVYPYELLRGETRGSAEVNYVVDAQGDVTASRVTKASRPEFGLALQAAVERFEYDPALKDGRPNATALGFHQDFEGFGPLVANADHRLMRLEEKHPERIVKMGDLDAPPKAIVMRSPIFPRSLAGRVSKGEALVEILVDEDGSPHLPRIVSASDPAFGYAAVQAVSMWRFDPLKSKGKGAVVRVRVPFVFKPKVQASLANAAP